jgi:hypothetical protein
LKVRVLLLFALLGVTAVAEPVATPVETILENYCAAESNQARLSKGASMEVEIAASLPRLKKHGKLHALRRISSLGRVTYEMLGFEGDGTVKNQVIARYLTAEAEAQKEEAPSMAVIPANYKFKYRGRGQIDAVHFPEEGRFCPQVRDSRRGLGAPPCAERSADPAGGQGGADHRLQPLCSRLSQIRRGRRPVGLPDSARLGGILLRW